MKSNTTPENLTHSLESFTKAELTWCFIFNKTGINIDNTDGQYINKIYIWIKINTFPTRSLIIENVRKMIFVYSIDDMYSTAFDN